MAYLASLEDSGAKAGLDLKIAFGTNVKVMAKKSCFPDIHRLLSVLSGGAQTGYDLPWTAKPGPTGISKFAAATVRKLAPSSFAGRVESTSTKGVRPEVRCYVEKHLAIARSLTESRHDSRISSPVFPGSSVGRTVDC